MLNDFVVILHIFLLCDCVCNVQSKKRSMFTLISRKAGQKGSHSQTFHREIIGQKIKERVTESQPKVIKSSFELLSMKQNKERVEIYNMDKKKCQEAKKQSTLRYK